jgi:hypothetical protein
MTSSLGRILVVDDEPQVGAMLRDLLVEFGYVVKTTISGVDALPIVRGAFDYVARRSTPTCSPASSPPPSCCRPKIPLTGAIALGPEAL